MIFMSLIAAQIGQSNSTFTRRAYKAERLSLEAYRQAGVDNLDRLTGMYTESTGAYRRLSGSCINCGAPREAICSYCKTVS